MTSVRVSFSLSSHLEMWLLQDPGQFSRAVVLNLEVVDVTQDLCHQLHVVVLHRLQLHFLQLLMSLEGDRSSGRGGSLQI